MCNAALAPLRRRTRDERHRGHWARAEIACPLASRCVPAGGPARPCWWTPSTAPPRCASRQVRRPPAQRGACPADPARRGGGAVERTARHRRVCGEPHPAGGLRGLRGRGRRAVRQRRPGGGRRRLAGGLAPPRTTPSWPASPVASPTRTAVRWPPTCSPAPSRPLPPPPGPRRARPHRGAVTPVSAPPRWARGAPPPPGETRAAPASAPRALPLRR